MKLAITFGLAGALFGQQFATVEVHDELRTKSLVLQGSGARADAVLRSTDSGGLLVELGKGGKYSGATLAVDQDAGGWSIVLADEYGTSIKSRVCDGDAYIELLAREEGARCSITATEMHRPRGEGRAWIDFYPGRPEGFQDANMPCSLGVSDDHSFLQLRKRIETAVRTEDEPLLVWDEVIQVSGTVADGPWND